MASTPARDLAQAAAELTAAPTDLAVWLRVCAALAAAGKPTDAARAFAQLGASASELGQVALAATCARWLHQNKQPAAAKKLVDDLAATHARGSERVDVNARPAPPPRGSLRSPVGEVAETTLEAAVVAATAAVAAARDAAKGRVPDKLPATPLLHALEVADVVRLLGLMKLTVCPPGKVVVDVGQPATALYWIGRGSASVTRGEHKLGDLRSGALFGEIALVAATTRTAKVTCDEETWLLEIPSAAVEEMAGKAPTLAKVLAEYARARLLANVMRTSAVFQRLGDRERGDLLPRFVPRMLAVGDKVIEKGKINETLFVVVAGKLHVVGADGRVAGLGPGDAAGEMSLLSGQPAVADVLAGEPSCVLTLPRAAFDDVVAAHPGLLAEVYKLKREREQAGTDAMVVDAEELIV